MRALEELIDPSRNGNALVENWLRDAKNEVEVLPTDAASGARCLLSLQVTTRSPMGAIAYSTGGLLVDGGWVRVLGGGGAKISRSIASWNAQTAALDAALVVGEDVVGGFFAINGGGLPGERGGVSYFAPDALQWQELGANYSQWIAWLFQTDLGGFYGDLRWSGWRPDTVALGGDQGLLVYPFPSAGGAPLAERTKRPVPMAELWELYV
jgi:hypothetical protein